MLTVSEKTFVRLSVGIISSVIFAAFVAGMAWKRFETLEVQVSDLNDSVVSLNRKLDDIILKRLSHE